MTPSVPTRGSDRAQLLLVGAVTLALIVLGLTAVTNTVLFTENTGPGEATRETASIEQFDYEGTKSVRSILLQINHRERNVSMSDIETNATANISSYSDALARTYAFDGSTFVAVNYTETVTNATRIVQSVDRNFTYNASHSGSFASDQADWEPLPSTERAEIGWFSMNVDLRNTSAEQATIVVENRTGGRFEYSLNRSANGSGTNLTVQVHRPATGSTVERSCGSTGGRVALSLHAGTGALGQCTFPSFSEIDGPYSVSITDGDNIAGKYEIVANTTWHRNAARLDAAVGGASEPYPNCLDPGIQPPCLAPVVWTAEAQLQYRSANANFSGSRIVNVYGAGGSAPLRRFPGGTVFTGISQDIIQIAGDGGPTSTLHSASGNIDGMGSPGNDVTGDGSQDVPFISDGGSSRKVKVTNVDGNVTTLATDSDVPGDIVSQKTGLAIGSWNGSPNSVFFVDDNNDKIYRASPSGVSEVADPGNGAQAVVGPEDIDGDGDDELIFADASQTLRYMEPDGSKTNVPDGGVGSNGGIGSGSAGDFNDDGVIEIVVTSGSNEIKITGEDPPTGIGEIIIDPTSLGGPEVAKAPIRAADIDGDNEEEIVYVEDNPSQEIYYMDDPLSGPTVKQLLDDNGNPITGSQQNGVT